MGVLGGMGPDATVDFMARVIAMTPAKTDQDHIHMLVDHNPTVPDRQEAILGGGKDPGPVLAAMATRLESAGAEFLVMPCNTAHVFQDSIIAAAGVPLLSIIDVTIAEVQQESQGAEAVGILATHGCLKTRVYQDAIEAQGMRPVVSNEQETARVMKLIYRIKAGDKSHEIRESMRELAEALQGRGAQAVIAGCTEIPLVLDGAELPIPLISSTDVLAKHTVALALGERPLPMKEA